MWTIRFVPESLELQGGKEIHTWPQNCKISQKFLFHDSPKQSPNPSGHPSFLTTLQYIQYSRTGALWLKMGVQGGNLFFDPKEPLQCMADTSKKTKLYFGEGRSDIKPFVPLSHNCGYFTRSLCSFHLQMKSGRLKEYLPQKRMFSFRHCPNYSPSHQFAQRGPLFNRHQKLRFLHMT